MNMIQFKRMLEFATNISNIITSKTIPVFVMFNNVKYGFTFDLQRFIKPDKDGNFGKVSIIHNEDPISLFNILKDLESIMHQITDFGGNPSSFIMDHNYEIDFVTNIKYHSPEAMNVSFNREIIVFISERDFE